MKKANRITESELKILQDREWRECMRQGPALDVVPDHWLTSASLARREGVSLISAQRRLYAGVASGRVARRKFRILVNGRPLAVHHYCPLATLERLEPNDQAEGVHSD